MQFKLAVQSAILRCYPLPLAVEKIRAAGYDAIELWGGQFHGYYLDLLQPGTSLEERRLDTRKIEAIRDICTSADLPITCYTPEQCFYPINYLADTVEPFEGFTLTRRSVDEFKLCIDITGALGCKRMLLTTPHWGWKRTERGYEQAGKEEMLAAALPTVRELVGHAENQGVTLLLEPLSYLETTAVETLDDVLTVLTEINSPALAVTLDTGHENITARRLGKDPNTYLVEYLRRLGNRLQHVHIDDNRGDVDAHLVPGRGNISFGPFLRALAAAGYTGYLSAELAVFGTYPLPPEPERLLAETKEFVLAQ